MRTLIIGNITQNNSLAWDYSQAEAFLIRIGLKPINLNESIGTSTELNSLVALHLDQLKNCDAVFMLNCWIKCPCARIVHSLAVENGKQTIYQNLIAGDRIFLATTAISAVESASGMKLSEFARKCRKREYYFARLILVNYLTKLSKLDEQEIADMLGRDLTTVKYSLREFPSVLKYAKEFREMYEKAEINLQNRITVIH